MLVAVVVAYDNPRLEADLAVYRSTFGLPPCTTANGCFRKVDQRGGKTYPQPDAGWGVEAALDVQAISAACPKCRILAVMADDPYLDIMGGDVNTAVRLGAKVVNHSYGADEFGGWQQLARDYYTHPGTAQVVASGDWGFTTASLPAALPHSIAVGGTVLERKSWGWKETVWYGSGSGCSAWIDKPAWQKDPNCLMRTIADISAVADNFAVYDTFGLGDQAGWITVGGTSLASPLVAGFIARAGHPERLQTAQYLYTLGGVGLKDVVSGWNGSCGEDYLCTGMPGDDAPTGMGAPRGLAAL